MRMLSFAFFAGVFLFSAGSEATTIVFSATDLPDVVSGEDLWEYSYVVSGRSFAAGEGFSVFFDYTLYEQLESPPPQVSPDWDSITLQPDLLLPDDGLYDALAMVSSPSLAQTFTVSFVWLGAGTPGAQPFAIYDNTFQAIESGTTVPEPGVSALVLPGLLALWITSFGRRYLRDRMNA